MEKSFLDPVVNPGEGHQPVRGIARLHGLQDDPLAQPHLEDVELFRKMGDMQVRVKLLSSLLQQQASLRLPKFAKLVVGLV